MMIMRAFLKRNTNADRKANGFVSEQGRWFHFILIHYCKLDGMMVNM